MPEEEVTRLEANLAQDEAAAVRVVRVVHPQHGNTASLRRLENFHRKCVRAMAGTTMFMTWKHPISAFKLEQRLGLRGIKSYIAENALRWLGHVARMPFNKLPRRLLMAWVYMPPGIKHEFKLGMRRTYGASMLQQHFTYLLGEGGDHKGDRDQERKERRDPPARQS